MPSKVIICTKFLFTLDADDNALKTILRMVVVVSIAMLVRIVVRFLLPVERILCYLIYRMVSMQYDMLILVAKK